MRSRKTAEDLPGGTEEERCELEARFGGVRPRIDGVEGLVEHATVTKEVIEAV